MLCVPALVFSEFMHLSVWRYERKVCMCVCVLVHRCAWKMPRVSVCACLFTDLDGR